MKYHQLTLSHLQLSHMPRAVFKPWQWWSKGNALDHLAVRASPTWLYIQIVSPFKASGMSGFTLWLWMGTGDRFICDTGLSIAVNQSETGHPSTRFGFLCMHRTVSTYLLAGLTMSAKRDNQTAMSKSLKSGTLPTFTLLRSLLSVEKVARELVYRNLPVQTSSATHSKKCH